jgi:hypothetical protein
MAGELWRSYIQFGKQVSANSPVAATRKMYFRTDGSRFSRERAPRVHRHATGGRQNVGAVTLGPTQVSGTLVQALSASEIIELLLMTIRAGVTPTGAGAAKLWVFTPGETLEAATAEWYDGARAWQVGGVYGDKLRISGNVREETVVTCDVFGLTMEPGAMTAALPDRQPDFIEGWETKFYLDAFGGTARTTAKSGALINWDIEVTNGLARKYHADNALSPDAITIDQIEIKATLLIEASAALAATEFANWNGVTQRLLGLEFGQNKVIDGSDKAFVTIDIPGAWEAVDLGQTDEKTRAYELRLQYVYDPTNAYGLQIRAQNARSSAF